MSGNHFFKKTILTASMGIALGLYGCGGGSSSNGGGTQEAVNTGVFIDAPVKGLEYSTTTQSGVTNEQGEFKYKTGENVVFKIDGLEIGTVAGASEVPVTALPQYIDVARLLQSLDIDTLEELIDISGIKISESLKSQLKDLLENNQGDFDTVLTQEQLDAIESDSQVQLVNATPVTEQAAVQHISGSISENLTDNDFNRQSYIGIDEGTVLSFKDDGTGFEFNDGGGSNGSPYKSPFTWSVTNNKLDVNYTNGETVNVGLLSVDGNKYVIAGATQEGSFTTALNKAKPLSLTELNGKILAFDVSDDSDCSARTIKITGNSVNMKEVCTDGTSELPMTLSTVSNLDNTLEIGFTKDGIPHTIMMVLIEGSIAQSGTVAFIHKKNNVFTAVELESITATDKEAEAPVTPPNTSFQVVNKKLVMKSETSNTGVNNQVKYGFSSTAQDPTFIASLDADLSLIESSITGNGRARIAFYQEMKSSSTSEVASIFVAIDHRASGIASKAYLKVNGVETPISGIHNKPLENGKSYHFNIDTTGNDISISIAGHTASIPKSIFSSGDIFVSHANFHARVKNAEAGNFAKGSVDNIILKRDKDGVVKTITRNFDDGVTPVADDELNIVSY